MQVQSTSFKDYSEIAAGSCTVRCIAGQCTLVVRECPINTMREFIIVIETKSPVFFICNFTGTIVPIVLVVHVVVCIFFICYMLCLSLIASIIVPRTAVVSQQ